MTVRFSDRRQARRQTTALGWLLAIALTVAVSSSSVAHPMPHSAVYLDVRANSVAATLELPVSDLELAFGRPVSNDPAIVQRDGESLRQYLVDHVRPVTSGGIAWQVDVEDLNVVSREGDGGHVYEYLIVSLNLVPPRGASPRSFELGYDVIVHLVVSHIADVYLRPNWAQGTAPGPWLPLPEVRTDSRVGGIPMVEVALSS